MATIAEQREHIGKLVGSIRELADRQDSWTAEDRSTWERVNADYDAAKAALDADLESRTKSEAVLARLQEIEQTERQRGKVGSDGVEQRRRNPENQLLDERRAADLAVQAAMRYACFLPLTDEHRSACERMGVRIDSEAKVADVPISLGLVYGRQAWTIGGAQQPREVRADANMSIGGSNVGSQLIPQGFGPELERKLLAFGGPRNVCRVWRTPTGNAVPWPTIDDTANSGALLAEETTIGDTLAAATGSVTFNAYKYSSKPIKMSAELLEDSAVGLGELAGSLLGERLGRAIGVATTTGTGSSQPNGIVTGSAAGVTAASATAITGDEIIGLVHSVDPAYRGMSSGFMMNDGILLYLRKLKDGNGQYLWQPGMSAGVPDRLYGYPVTINQHMQSTVATSTKTVLFGDFEKFVIREVGSVRFYRLEELYRATDQTGFVAFMRIDSDILQSAAIKHLVQA